jgi:hypothetical protein
MTLAAALGALAVATAGEAQTGQPSSNSSNGTPPSTQPQSDPVGQTHSDGQSGKSSRPNPHGADVPPNWNKLPQ